jgi:hypothetical protein
MYGPPVICVMGCMDHRSYVLWAPFELRARVVIWYTYMDGGWGLAPALSAPKPKHIAIQIISKLYSGKNHYSGAPVGRPFPKPYPCPEVAGSSPADYTSFNQCPGDTWRPLFGPRVTNPFATMPRVKK